VSNHVMSGREDTEIRGAPAALRSTGVSFALLLGALAIGFAAGLKACPPCPH
jgi:hypothetical protein